MKIKKEVWITILFAIFAVLALGSAFSKNSIFNELLLFLIIAVAILFIGYIIKALIKTPNSKLIEAYKKQNIILKILDIVVVIVAIYEFTQCKYLQITYIITSAIILIHYYEWFVNKEE